MYIIGKKCGEKMKDYSEYFKGPNLKEAQKRSRKQVDHLKDAFEIPSDMVSVGKGKTYYIHTYGCQANERDGETLAGIFEMMGYTAAKEIEEADVILLNTCAIRENAEEKVFGKVGYVKNLKKKNPNLIFGLLIKSSTSSEMSVNLYTIYYITCFSCSKVIKNFVI